MEWSDVEREIRESRIPGLMTDTEFDLYLYKEYKRFIAGEYTATASTDSPTVGESVTLRTLRKELPEIKEGYVTERRAGRYVERRVRNMQAQGGLIRRLPYETLFDGTVVKPYVLKKDIEIDPETGEEIIYADTIRLCKDGNSRFSNPHIVRRTCDNFKWLIRANESDIRLFVTLTYKRNMTDTKQLYQDYRKFVQKLKRAYPCITGYLVAFEPQKRGAWHAHVLLLSHKPFLYIPNKRMRGIWGHGYTKTQAVRKIKDIGSYLTAYLTNVKEGAKTKKGARLGMYPKGFHFLRSSKDGVSRTALTRWYGEFDKINLPGNCELIYDYENVRRVNRELDLYKVTKIFCFKETDPPPN